VLSIHAGYRCRNTGVCCSAGWDIPVEAGVEMHLRNALSSGTLRVPEALDSSPPPGTHARRATSYFRPVAGHPHGARVVLASDFSGRCSFLHPDRRCAVHGQLGPEALPSACRDFPRVVTLTPLGVSITLSHYCPTAAASLLPIDPRRAGPEGDVVTIVENPPGFPPTWPYQGLDARDALPPLLRPGVLMDWPSLERWETFAVSVLGDERRSPEAALDAIAAAAEAARAWTPEAGAFEGYLEGVLEEGMDPSGGGEQQAFLEARRNRSRYSRDPAGWGSREWQTRAWQAVASCVPHRALLPLAPEGLDDADQQLVAPAWPSVGLPIRRWLAAKAFASWLVLQSDGLRTAVLGLRVALAVLRAEAARGCAEARRPLDGELLKEAVRRADLLLVHLVDPEAFARRLRTT
jgi:Fe-S-cluster containining protein